jgi:amino acid adenylation domain-containing protein
MSEAAVALQGVEDAYPLAPAQAGMLFHSLSQPDSGVYLGQFSAVLPAGLDVEAFKAAWRSVIRRHGALRTLFVWEGVDDPVQVVRDAAEPLWSEFDWRHLEPAEARDALDALMEHGLREGIDLSQAPAMALAMAELADGRRRFVWTCHHALLDDWSAALVLRDVAAAYVAHAGGEAPELEPAVSFRPFVDWLAGRDEAAAESYWREVLGDLRHPTRLLTPPPETQPMPGPAFETGERTLSAEASEGLRGLAAGQRVTLGALIVSAWAVVLHRCSGQDEVVFGVANTLRPPELPGIEAAVGNFVTTLPARVGLDRDANMKALIRRCHEEALAARDHGFLGLSRIQRASGIAAGQALFETIVALDQEPPSPGQAASDDPPLFDELTARDQSNYPLALLVLPGERLRLKLIHDPARYDKATAGMILSMMEAALTALPGSLDAAPFNLPVLTEAEIERAKAGETGAGTLPPFGPVHVEFAAQAARFPDRPAVVFGPESLSYGELERRANQVARRLAELGLGRGDRVAVFLERSPAVLVAILGALKAGCAYVPLDAAYASDRLAWMLGDCDAQVLVTESARREALPEQAPRVLLLDDSGGADDGIFSLPDVGPGDPAYLIYTSGSTGQPKGVVVAHRNISASTAARLTFYGQPPGVFLLLSSFAFDSSLVGIFWTLCTGGTLVLPAKDGEKDIAGLAGLIRAQGVTDTLCLPSLHELLLRYADARSLAPLRRVIVAGEECPRALVTLHHAHAPSARLYNEYGPTEATVWCTAALLDELSPAGRVPIGRPIPGACCLLLDRRGRVVPAGLPAELYVGGEGVALGYFGQDDATAERFVADPVEGSGRLYRTGDIVRRRPDGQFEYLGRADDQVKVRGFRIEPAEVEAVLGECPGVRQVAVSAYGEGPDAALAAFILPEPDLAEGAEDPRSFAQRKLPEWMRPARFIMVDALPLSANGKLDRAALPSPRDRTEDAAAAVAPRTPLEAALARVWRQVLWLDRELSVTENFFDLGGHSLLSIRLINEIEGALGVKLPAAALGRITTIAEQADLIEGMGTGVPKDASDVQVDSCPGAIDPFAGLSGDEAREVLGYTAGWPGKPVGEGAPVFLLNEGGSLPPLIWCFNSGHEFAEAARHLGPSQPVYGLRSGNLILDLTPESQQRNNRRLAIHYLPEILRLQSEGPYYLGGNCQGAAVAMELALALQGLGKPVGLVVLMEAVPIHAFHGRVALIFGRDSEFNPLVESDDPERAWNRSYLSHSVDMIEGRHGVYFDEPYALGLRDVLERRLEEARAESAWPLPEDASSKATGGANQAERDDVQGSDRLSVSLQEGRLALSRGNYEAGAKALLQAHGETSALLLDLGECQLRLGDLAAARKSFALALELEPGEPRALYGLARASEADGDLIEAYWRYRRCLVPKTDPEVYALAEAAAARLDPVKRFRRGVKRLLRRRKKKGLGEKTAH